MSKTFMISSFSGVISGVISGVLPGVIPGVLSAVFLLLPFCLPAAEAEDFFPLGLYAVPREHIKTAAGLDFNTVVTGYDREYFDGAAEAGLKVISPLYLINHDTSIKKIRELDGHPALYAWYYIDEPDIQKISPEQVKEWYAELKAIAPKTPSFITLWNPDKFPSYGSNCEFFGTIAYPVREKSKDSNHLEMVYSVNYRAKAALPGKKVFAIIQTFAGLPNWQRPPDMEELRCMAWQALIIEVDGILFYSFESGEEYRVPGGRGTWYLTEDTATAGNLKALNAEIKANIPAIKKGREQNGLITNLKYQQVPMLYKYYDGASRLYIVNPFNEDKYIECRLKGLEGQKIILGLSGLKYKKEGDYLVFTLPARKTAAFVIK